MITRAFQFAVVVALMSVTVFFCALTAGVIVGTKKLTHTIELADRTIAETGEAMTNVRDASRAWNKNSAAQAKAVLATEQAARRSMGDLDQFIEHTDTQLNGMVLPQLTNLVAHQETSLDNMESQVSIATSKFSRDSSAMLEQTTNLISKLSQDAADPAIQASLKNVEQATANTAAATKNVQQTTVVLEDYAKRLTKPASMLKQVALGALQVGYQLRGLLGL